VTREPIHVNVPVVGVRLAERDRQRPARIASCCRTTGVDPGFKVRPQSVFIDVHVVSGGEYGPRGNSEAEWPLADIC